MQEYNLFSSGGKDSRCLARQFRKAQVSNTAYHRRLWSGDDKQFFVDNYIDKHSLHFIATHLKRTVIAVEVKVYQLKLLQPKTDKNTTPKDPIWMQINLARMKELINFCQYVSRVLPHNMEYLLQTANIELRRLSKV